MDGLLRAAGSGGERSVGLVERGVPDADLRSHPVRPHNDGKIVPTYEYLCSCGERFDRRSKPSTSETAQCTCGKDAERQFTPNGSFFIPAYANPSTQVTWNEIAPIDDLGHPMGKREAAKVVDRYDPDARAKQEGHDRALEDKQRRVRMEDAKREAWREHSRNNRIVV